MDKHILTRTELLIGRDAVNKLRESKVMVFGVGGVGSFTVEALARTGVGTLILVDNDTVDITNINRQIIATHETIDRSKVDVAKERIATINKECNVITKQIFITNEGLDEIIPSDVDYVVDAIDTVTAKIALAVYCEENNIPLISSMGTGNKIDPTQFKVTDIYKTKVCPLAKVMRSELKKRGVKKLKVVYSEEIARKPHTEYLPVSSPTEDGDNEKVVINKRATPGSIGFVPPVAGMIIASQVVRDLVELYL